MKALWRKWRKHWKCGMTYRHCWHADGFIGWTCCLCGHNIDGWPPNECTLCAKGEHHT